MQVEISAYTSHKREADNFKGSSFLKNNLTIKMKNFN